MAIPITKKRYQLALEEQVVKEFQEAAGALGFNRNVMSAVCNAALKKTSEIFRRAKQKDGFTMIDLFSMVGEEMESINNIEKGEKGNDEKGKTVTKGKKRIES